MNTWSSTSWKSKPVAQDVHYDNPQEVDAIVTALGRLPPLVTAWEVDRLRGLLAEAQEGRRFLLQGGDCAESLSECRPDIIINRQKIFLQMSLVLIHGGHRPVIRVGRIAGQYAKPRSKPTEMRNGVELPSYFGDLVNRPDFTSEARRADPRLMLDCYHHAAMTLNLVRSLSDGGFADVHHPENWDLSFFRQAAVPPELRTEYEQTTHKLSEALGFMEALGERTVTDLTRVDFYTSHEGLNLHYESAQTHRVPQRTGWYDLTTHMPWIGERTRSLDGAHVEFFRGIRNPVGVKLGPSVKPEDAVRLAERLCPDNEPGKLVFITRMGVQRVTDALPPLVQAVRNAGRRVLWVCDPMHGNTTTTSSGIKTRSFNDVLREVELTLDVHEQLGSHLGGVHFELTGEDVTECVGGAAGITEQDLERNYATLCDPRLNYRQALEMSFRIAQRMSRLPRVPRS
ncbi:class II 3-deoxy-7-phosphoheptulonate synthase [Archangium sp.]|uniref:class II 3-deoxy-7-phosphoheptulonate synthase n=1 Tax=Archangium sp. TaxID=1872627 RepID=UPI002D61E535|nr:3-deoxy-7-phosphoheptulonate synthase class II [Archangium sp.]HYO53506.1 3-deoxy-7-phosphoheptulonate synthase class II [Archangium sp.]